MLMLETKILTNWPKMTGTRRRDWVHLPINKSRIKDLLVGVCHVPDIVPDTV